MEKLVKKLLKPYRVCCYCILWMDVRPQPKILNYKRVTSCICPKCKRKHFPDIFKR
jgi:hypothetical protein